MLMIIIMLVIILYIYIYFDEKHQRGKPNNKEWLSNCYPAL